MNSLTSNRLRLSAVLSLLCIATLGAGCTRQTTFASPDEAVNSLMAAARTDSSDQLNKIFGSGSSDLLSSGDPTADRNAIERFVGMYDEKHHLETVAHGQETLVVGSNDWPFPIPLVKNNKDAWYFDTAAGKDEIINRRIGRNELDTIGVCLAIVDAQREYAMEDRDGDTVPEYAQKFLSDNGKKNGLYWPTAEGEPPSPLGELVVSATQEGYKAEQPDARGPTPFHGYLFRMLKSQGPDAKGGAYEYFVGDQMIGGFAVVAYPATYGNSGIVTFIVNHDGVVYQQDLGKKTESIAKNMTEFNPSEDWTPAEIPEATP